MKRIRIIKPKRGDDANEVATETKKPVEPSTRKIVNTVKNWIAESQQRKRRQQCSLTALVVLVLIASA